jgi:hypothetical protein
MSAKETWACAVSLLARREHPDSTVPSNIHATTMMLIFGLPGCKSNPNSLFIVLHQTINRKKSVLCSVRT